MPQQQLEPRYISLDQASSYTQLSTKTLRRAIKAGRLQCHRIGRRIRIELVELERWIRANGKAIEACCTPGLAKPGTAEL